MLFASAETARQNCSKVSPSERSTIETGSPLGPRKSLAPLCVSVFNRYSWIFMQIDMTSGSPTIVSVTEQKG
jgi:hypothetical protein